MAAPHRCHPDEFVSTWFYRGHLKGENDDKPMPQIFSFLMEPRTGCWLQSSAESRAKSQRRWLRTQSLLAAMTSRQTQLGFCRTWVESIRFLAPTSAFCATVKVVWHTLGRSTTPMRMLLNRCWKKTSKPTRHSYSLPAEAYAPPGRMNDSCDPDDQVVPTSYRGFI